MRKAPVTRIPRCAVLWALVTVLCIGLAWPVHAAPMARPTVTSVTCLPVPHAVTSDETTALLALADRKLSAAAAGAPPKRKPFGALRAEAEYQRTNSEKWTAGFFAAELWRMFQATRDERWLSLARASTKSLLPIARFTGTHDLGFMVGLPTGLGAQLDPDASRRTTYAKVSATAARTLDTRWNAKVRALKSSDYDGQWGVIIDSAMNAPLLIEVGQRTQDAALVDHGTAHMRTLASTFVRDDGSTYHRMAFDPRTGAVLGPIAGQGLAAESTWARGQAWAINGFARAYELTGDPTLKEAAIRTADFWLDRVPAGCITAWDFDIDNPRSPRDSGASAITASGLLRLAKALGPDGTRYREYANTSLALLTSRWLTTTYSVNPGLLLQQTVNVNNDPREGSYVWGDYYLLDALIAPELR